MPPRFAAARRAARKLLRDANINACPVSVEKLADAANAVIRYEPFAGDLSGMAYRRENAPSVIGVNSLDGLNRQRFTIAHEIGHLLLHDHDEIHIDERFIGFRNEISGLGVDDSEIEANQFAAELLMPEEWMIREIQGKHLDFESEDVISALAKKYGVSLQAMTIRLASVVAKK